MDLPTKVKQRFNNVEKLYLSKILPAVSDYELKINIVDIPDDEEAINLSEPTAGERGPSFSMDINLTSQEYGKWIEFSFSDGYTVGDNGYFNSLDFSFRKFEEKSIENRSPPWFNIQDYFTHNGINDEIDDFFDATNYDESTKKISKFIEQIVFLLERDDIKHILSSKDWLDVPHDKSMYF